MTKWCLLTHAPDPLGVLPIVKPTAHCHDFGQLEPTRRHKSVVNPSRVPVLEDSSRVKMLKGIYTPAGSLTFSNSGLPDHHSPTLWHWMLIILILLIHVTTRQQWNASWQSKRRRNGTNSEHSHCGCRPRNSWVTRNDRVHEGQWNG